MYLWWWKAHKWLPWKGKWGLGWKKDTTKSNDLWGIEGFINWLWFHRNRFMSKLTNCALNLCNLFCVNYASIDFQKEQSSSMHLLLQNCLQWHCWWERQGWAECIACCAEWSCSVVSDCLPTRPFCLWGLSRPEYWSGFAMPSSRGSSQPRDRTQVSHIAGVFFIIWTTREAHEYWSG